MPTELKGEALLDYYREAVRVCYGEEIAEASELLCYSGWYILKQARRCADGSVGVYSQISPPACRAAQVREMADELLRRAEEAAKWARRETHETRQILKQLGRNVAQSVA